MGFLQSCRAAAAATLFLGAINAPRAGAQAIVRGVLYDDSTGAALRGTVMLVDPATDAPVVYSPTDSLGTFELKARDGAYRIAAIREGYTRILSAPVNLRNGERMTIRVPIAISGDPRHQIGVVEHVRPADAAPGTGSRTALDRVGYGGRKLSGLGLHYDHRDFDKTTSATLGEFLQAVPGLFVGDPASTRSMRMTRSTTTGVAQTVRGPSLATCHVGWFVDGYRVDLPGRADPLTDGLGLTDLRAVEAVEVFRGVSEMPAQFAAPDLNCGAIAVWTIKP
ncbi:MAG TPA: TonB-dependent receptor [Gemmatimonadaceae bacterium]|nr:TonB-dependent receptor [Gemmatimonadaceae bacterium]